MPEDYDYGNARLRAMRSRLLTEADYENLLAQPNIEALISALTDTPYREDIEAALARFEGVDCVFAAVRAHMTQTLGKIREFFEGQPRFLLDLLLQRWDRHNLLAILRGQSLDISPQRILSTLVPVGRLDQVSLRELVHQPDIRALIDLMTVWQLPYAQALRQVWTRAEARPDLDELELALNRAHYASIQTALGQGNGNQIIMREHFQVEVDLLNLRLVFRLAGWPDLVRLVQQRYDSDDIHPLLIDFDGAISVRRLTTLVAKANDLEEVVRELRATRYGPALQAGWQRYEAGERNPAVLGRALECWQAKYTAAMFRRDPLSIAILIGYLGCKEVEVANLRLIAQAIDLGLDREEVREDLIIVR